MIASWGFLIHGSNGKNISWPEGRRKLDHHAVGGYEWMASIFRVEIQKAFCDILTTLTLRYVIYILNVTLAFRCICTSSQISNKIYKSLN
jgi:hypothetical protein